ncbi:DNA topoisomerase VI subunit B [Candidatus Woesearchaeota archaeon]|nr:DNA topoisomerase VI subunit B [Candidatus Woesearchaeota archaeon]
MAREKKKTKKNRNMTVADELAKKQKDISVAEFFERNRHLLGFDNKRKALLTVVKEAVDNALDACEDAKILPEINIQIVEMGNDRYRITVEDNGPGIVKKQIPNIFAKLLYGSKFHTMKQARGQQGIGISAAVLYAQLTTGRPAKIWSSIKENQPSFYYELHIDTIKNIPEIVKDQEVPWKKDHGTKIELDIDASYQKGDQSVDSYLKQTAIANPHATIVYTNPKAEQLIFPRATDKLPKEPTEIKPHPYGVELGIMLKMIKATVCRTLQSFLTQEFSRVGPQTAKEICDKAGLFTNMKPHEMQLPHVEKLIEAIKNTKIIAPSTDCIVPIGEQLLEKGLRKEVAAEFYTSVSRSPDVYRGIPFVIEVALAYGGEQQAEGSVNLLRFANRVPLLYQQGSCACTKSLIQTNWKPYGLTQSQGAIPSGPLTVVVSMVSVWPPFTSEAKEAIAHYPEIIKEMKLALQEAGRRLGSYVNKKRRVSEQQERVNIFENYIPEVADALSRISGIGKEKIAESMKKMLAKNKEYIQAHKEAHQVEKKEKKDKEEQVELKGFEDE